jgi:hypothetical protein
VDSEGLLNLDRDLPVTAEDVDALRRLRVEVPSWLSLDWKTLEAMVGPSALDRRPLARDEWPPFSLDELD